ncbi:MAG: MarR family transcriptional regulator [Gemmatimonadetes bacterium]|nr:MarR family transcriptional regulator [Gemmatimonadota bacterium]
MRRSPRASRRDRSPRWGVRSTSDGTRAPHPTVALLSEPAAAPTQPRTPDEERALRLWIALARCYATFARTVSTRVAEYGLTTPQFGVLEALYHLGPLPLGELAAKLLVTGGNITYVMDRLEEQGLVLRERSSQDRRVVRAQLTEAGERLVAKAFPRHALAIADLAAELGPEEQEALRDLLKRLGKGIAGRPESP